jgi:thiosulfate/3-mercaptopyruvate sulfurtransferase
MNSTDSARVKPYATNVSLVSPKWVAEHLNDQDLRILDLRTDVYAYFPSHVPNAVNISEAAFRAPLAGLPAQYLSPDHTAYLLSRAGVSNSSRVVLYSDDENVLGATMLAYVLAKLGHPEVMIMDGGWNAYRSSQPTTKEYPVYPEIVYQVRDLAPVGISLEALRAIQGKQGVKLIDSRPEKAYTGESRYWIRNGHIPGAINVPWQTLTMSESAHTFRPISDIEQLFSSRGIKRDDYLVIYCGTGREASIEFVALKHLLGYPEVRIYEGSWNEYSAYAELPIVTGKEPSGQKAA